MAAEAERIRMSRPYGDHLSSEVDPLKMTSCNYLVSSEEDRQHSLVGIQPIDVVQFLNGEPTDLVM